MGMRHDERGIHGLGRVEYEIRDGEVVFKDEGPVRVMVTEAARRSHDGAHPARSQRSAHHGVRDRLRGPQPHLHLEIHRYDPAGGGLPRRPGVAGRRRRARACPGRWAGPQHRRAGCDESGVEAGPGGQRDIPENPPGHLPRRAPPGRRPRAAQHDGAGRASPPGRAHEGLGRDHCRARQLWTSLADEWPR